MTEATEPQQHVIACQQYHCAQAHYQNMWSMARQGVLLVVIPAHCSSEQQGMLHAPVAINTCTFLFCMHAHANVCSVFTVAALLCIYHLFLVYPINLNAAMCDAYASCSLCAAVYPINLNEPRANLFTPKIVGAHITLLYYGGFCYMMLGRCVLCCSWQLWCRWILICMCRVSTMLPEDFALCSCIS